MYLYLLAFPFVSEAMSVVCTNPVPLGNRGQVHGKLIREKISNASRIWGKKNPVQTSHLTMHCRRVKSGKNRRGGNKDLLVGNKRRSQGFTKKMFYLPETLWVN